MFVFYRSTRVHFSTPLELANKKTGTGSRKDLKLSQYKMLMGCLKWNEEAISIIFNWENAIFKKRYKLYFIMKTDEGI